MNFVEEDGSGNDSDSVISISDDEYSEENASETDYYHSIKPSLNLQREYFNNRENTLKSILNEMNNKNKNSKIYSQSQTTSPSRNRKNSSNNGWRREIRYSSNPSLANHPSIANTDQHSLLQSVTSPIPLMNNGSSHDHQRHIFMPTRALSLMGDDVFTNGSNIKKSELFDNAFWNEDFMKHKLQRKQLKNNNGIQLLCINEQYEEEKEKPSSNHFQTLSKLRLKNFACIDVLVENIEEIFPSKMNVQWLSIICDVSERAMDTHSHHQSQFVSDTKIQTKTHNQHIQNVMGEVWDEKMLAAEMIIKHTKHKSIPLVPKLIYFTNEFFNSVECSYLFLLARQSIEVLMNVKDNTSAEYQMKVQMIEHLYAAFEKSKDFDRHSYQSSNYSQIQILEKKIVWIAEVQNKLETNPFLSKNSFKNSKLRKEYLNEFRSQLNEEMNELNEQHMQYMPTSAKLFQRFIKNSTGRVSVSQSIKERMLNTNNRKKKPKKKKLFGWFHSAKQKLQKKSNVNEPQLQSGRKRNSVHSYTKNTVFDGADLCTIVIEESQAAMAASETTFDEALPDVQLDHYSFYFILLCLLLRYYNERRNFLKFQICSYPIRLPDVGQRILDYFGTTTKCSHVYRVLCYLKIAMKVLTAEAVYFDDILRRLATLRDFMDEESCMLTWREECHTLKIVQRMMNWCRLCISRYQHIFNGAKGPRALKSCLRLWKYCDHFSLGLKLGYSADDIDYSVLEEKFSKMVEKIIKKSVFDYEFPRLVTLYQDNATLPALSPAEFKYNEISNDNIDLQHHMHSCASSDAGLARISKKVMNFIQYETKTNNTTKQRKPTLMVIETESKNDLHGCVIDDCPVEDATQLVMVLKAIRQYLILDEEEYHQVFAAYVLNFNLLNTTANEYMTLAFSFANIFLRVLADLLQDKLIEEKQLNSVQNTQTCPELEIDPNVWQLYQELKRFYDHLKKIHKKSQKYVRRKNDSDPGFILPAIHYNNHYEDIIKHWCDYQSMKYTSPCNGMVVRIIANDKWQPLSSKSLYSTSVIDLFTVMEPLSDWFTSLPYTRQNLIDFSSLLTNIVEKYVESIAQKAENELMNELKKKEMTFYRTAENEEKSQYVWEFPSTLVLCINDIIMAKTQLIQLLSNSMLDQRYTDVKNTHLKVTVMDLKKEINILEEDGMDNSSLLSTTIATHVQHHTSHMSCLSIVDSVTNMEIFNALNCVNVFSLINQKLQSLLELIAQALNADIEGEIYLMIWHFDDAYAPNVKLTNTQIEDELMDTFWKKCVLKCDAIMNNIRPTLTPFILSSFFSFICSSFIKFLIPTQLKFVLNKNQLQRVQHCISEIVGFFVEGYDVDKEYIISDENYYKLQLILRLQLASTKILINHHSELKQDIDFCEKFELKMEPYLGAKSFWLIIKHRVKYHKHDRVLRKYYKANTGIKAQFQILKKKVVCYSIFNSKQQN